MQSMIRTEWMSQKERLTGQSYWVLANRQHFLWCRSYQRIDIDSNLSLFQIAVGKTDILLSQRLGVSYSWKDDHYFQGKRTPEETIEEINTGHFLPTLNSDCRNLYLSVQFQSQSSES